MTGMTITKEEFSDYLLSKAKWVRRETLRIHGAAPTTRVASSLSCVEILTAMYYGGVVKYNPKDTAWPERDRFVISKGHGAISFYPILSDLGYFAWDELKTVCRKGTFLGGIPDPIIPGFETVNGSLGHGLGVACGMALALKRRNRSEKVFVLVGDGELYEGSIWEAVMFAAEQQLDNLMLIVDNNKACMLDFCDNIIDLAPLEDKFRAFKWNTVPVAGHDVNELHSRFLEFKEQSGGAPTVMIADTIKGKGVPKLEKSALSHVMNLSLEEVNQLIAEL